jgi:hypothetical protein
VAKPLPTDSQRRGELRHALPRHRPTKSHLVWRDALGHSLTYSAQLQLVSHFACSMQPCEQVLPEQGTGQPLFRPPFRLGRSQSASGPIACLVASKNSLEWELVLGWKNEANWSVVLFWRIVCATHCDIRMDGSPTNPSFLSAYITSLECCILGESPPEAHMIKANQTQVEADSWLMKLPREFFRERVKHQALLLGL